MLISAMISVVYAAGDVRLCLIMTGYSLGEMPIQMHISDHYYRRLFHIHNGFCGLKFCYLIQQGYKCELQSSEMQSLVPSALVGKVDVLFGNLEEIFNFHSEVFLRDLENCISNTELVALCFTQRV